MRGPISCFVNHRYITHSKNYCQDVRTLFFIFNSRIGKQTVGYLKPKKKMNVWNRAHNCRHDREWIVFFHLILHKIMKEQTNEIRNWIFIFFSCGRLVIRSSTQWQREILLCDVDVVYKRFRVTHCFWNVSGATTLWLNSAERIVPNIN